MIKIIFGLLCGLLYLTGLCFGWTYQEASVYVCIYLVPTLCIVSTLPISVGLVHRIVANKGRWLGIVALPFSWLYTAYYIAFTIAICNLFSDVFYIDYGSSIPIVEQQFNLCMKNLQHIADTCNTTYEEVNIIIYVKLFILIVVVNGILAYIAKPYHKQWEKLKKSVWKREVHHEEIS